MNVLEKILEEIKNNAKLGNMRLESVRIEKVEEIIRSHMDDGKDTNDDWIPVSERLPEPHKNAIVTVHSSEWISDYVSRWVPDGEKKYHPDKYFTTTGYINKRGNWRIFDEDGSLVACDKEFGKDKGEIYYIVTGWKPLPEPYKG